MRRLRYLKSANRDLVDIYDHITRQAGEQKSAASFVARLRAQCRKVADLPATLGRPRPELLPGMRSMPFRGYIIFFRYPDARTIEVINIVEGHRDLARLFGRGLNEDDA